MKFPFQFPRLSGKAWLVLALMTVCGWFGFANPAAVLPPLVLAVPAGLFWFAFEAESPKSAFKLGWLGGTMVMTACLYWVVLPVHNYGFVPWFLALFCPLLLGVFLGLYHGLFTLLVHLFKSRLSPLMLGISAGLAWGLLEWLRGWVFTGFPWLTLGSAFAPLPIMIQAASVIGGYGLSALLAGAACLAAAPLVHGKKGAAPLLVGLGLIALVLVYGRHNLDQPSPQGEKVDLALIQGNIEQSVKWNPKYQDSTTSRYLRLSRETIENFSPDLLIWPETAMPFFFQDGGRFAARVADFAHVSGVPVLSGSPGYEMTGVGDDYDLFNRAYLIGTSGRIERFYDKEHLVPFGEYVPFGDHFPFIEKLVQGVGDFSPGRLTSPLKLGDLALGVLICYETIFPELAQKRVRDGANILVNISNDAWFGRSSAPWQHLHLTALRAVEQGRFLVRATNTGITAIIDPKGRIITHTRLFKTETVTARVNAISQTTIFHEYYGLTIPGMIGLLTLLALFGLFRPAAGLNTRP